MCDDLIREVGQLLYREARLLGERALASGSRCSLMTPAAVWSSQQPLSKSSKAIAILDPDRYLDDDLTKEGYLVIFDDAQPDPAPEHSLRPEKSTVAASPGFAFGADIALAFVWNIDGVCFSKGSIRPCRSGTRSLT